jgi:hypothetical protein
MSLLVDPSYFEYSLCVCDRGTFGASPNCVTVPEAQKIDNVQGPVLSLYNDTFTDSWYGNQRMTSGLSTSWVIDKRINDEINSNTFVTQSTSNAGTISTFSPILSSTTSSTSSSPVLMINITFYLNLDHFNLFSDVIHIYEGKYKNK